MPTPVDARGALFVAIEFGRQKTAEIPPVRGQGLDLRIPLLGGEAQERIFPDSGIPDNRHGFRLLNHEDLRIGWSTQLAPDKHGLSAQTQALYHRMLAATDGMHLYRIWNYVPHINRIVDGTENYHAFCRGRSLAFEEALGDSFPKLLSAASAVGAEDDFLSLIFIAGPAAPRHVENPEQTPAYRYPAEHGPRAPSFSRATIARVADRTFTFISGTSAIKGHATIAPGTLLDQIECTLDNLRLVSREAGLGNSLGAGSCKERHFKIYLRHAADFAATRSRLEQELLRPTDIVTYLQADICRAALNVEIEATLVT